MPRKPKVVSIKELRSMLAAQERKLERLLAQREKLQAGLDKIDAEIDAMGGEAPAGPSSRAKTPRPRRAGRRATGRTLAEYAADVLKGEPKGMRVKDVMTAIAKAGYTSSSKDFYGIVAATLRDDKRFKKLSRGVYAMA